MSDVEKLTHRNQLRRKWAEEVAASEVRKAIPAPKKARRDPMKRIGARCAWVTIGAASALLGVYAAMAFMDGVILCAVMTLAAILGAVYCELC